MRDRDGNRGSRERERRGRGWREGGIESDRRGGGVGEKRLTHSQSEKEDQTVVADNSNTTGHAVT